MLFLSISLLLRFKIISLRMVMLWLIIVVVVGMQLIWRTSKRFVQTPSAKKRLQARERILVITAHPDDECMFFGPFILSATQKWGAKVSILCCSTGNHDGKGDIRKLELIKSGERLGVNAEDVRCLDDRDLPDDPEQKWQIEKLRDVISAYTADWKPTTIATFDSGGVSGHRNHRDLADAVTFMKTHSLFGQDVRVLLLESINVFRKYSKYLDVAIALHLDWSLIAIVSQADEAVISSAMKSHQSQMLWFRWLYIIFSRYMIVNTFSEVYTLEGSDTSAVPMKS